MVRNVIAAACLVAGAVIAVGAMDISAWLDGLPIRPEYRRAGLVAIALVVFGLVLGASAGRRKS